METTSVTNMTLCVLLKGVPRRVAPLVSEEILGERSEKRD